MAHTVLGDPRTPPQAGAPGPFDTLNAEQRQAVDHGLDRTAPASARPGALLVLAGAGSGKTLTLAARTARLVLAGADPNRILLLAFSRRAAQSLQRRSGLMLHQALGWGAAQPAPRLPWAGTFHGVGARLLRQYATRIGLAEHFTILDPADAQDLMGLLRHDLRLDATRQRFPLKDTCLAIYSRVVNSQRPLADVLREVYPWCAACEDALRQLFRAYVAEKQKQCVLDYDDLLLYWCEMLADDALARQLSGQFEHVLVDEYQDTNQLQASILTGLRPDGSGLTVVGDDAQAIYSFRGAQIQNILGFAQRFEPAARIVTLERNYRSTQPILDAANAVIERSPTALAKRLWTPEVAGPRPELVTVSDESAQARWVADRVLRHREDGLALRRQAVLFRTAHHSGGLELELTRRNIPFVKFGGLRFLEATHVKDVLSVLRFARNPRHRMAGLRSAQLVEGIGTAHAKRLVDQVSAAPDPLDALRAFRPPPAAAAHWAAFATLCTALGKGGDPWPTGLQRLTAWYRPQLQRLHENAPARLADVEQLLRLATGCGSCEEFLADLTLDPPEATSAESGPPSRDEDYLILSTIHSAKGQEWASVFVLNAVDGCMPSDLATGDAAQIEEERRLLYVAMTRARRHLHLMVPQRFYVTQQAALGDRHLYGARTRFIPDVLLDKFDTVTGVPDVAPAPEPVSDVAAIDVAARVRGAWS